MAAKRKKRRTAAQRRATAKMLAAARARRGAKRNARKRTRRAAGAAPRVVIVHNSPGGRMAGKRRRRRGTSRRKVTTRRRRVRSNPPRRRASRRRRSFRRNPPILRTIKSGAVSGIVALGGGIGQRQLSRLALTLPGVAGNPYIESAVDVAAAVGLGFLASMFKLPRGLTDSALTGAWMRASESVLKRHLPADVSTTLLGEDVFYGLTPGGGIPGSYAAGIGSYPRPQLAAGGMGAYPSDAGVVASEDFGIS